jgi:CheY-like chemotaxis protein
MIGCLYEHNCMRKSVAMYLNRLLILDDEPLTGQTIQSIAEFAGMEVRYTSDPDDFFTLVSDWEPGFIALDLIMPQMDGVQVLGELANRNCTANIIVTSGVGTRVLEAAARSAAEHGLRIAGVLSKPFSPPRLRELLKPGIHGPDGPPVQHNGSMDEQQTPFTKADLAAALDQKLIEVVYQPKVHCRTGMLSGFEALARWQHPPLGPVYTEEFIVKAEQWGLIDRLTEQVLEKSLDWLKSLPETISVQSGDTYLPSRMESVTLALNISATSLGNLKFF